MTFAPDLRLACWKSKVVARLVDAEGGPRIERVRAIGAAMEQRMLSEQASYEAEVLRLWGRIPTRPGST